MASLLYGGLLASNPGGRQPHFPSCHLPDLRKSADEGGSAGAERAAGQVEKLLCGTGAHRTEIQPAGEAGGHPEGKAAYRVPVDRYGKRTFSSLALTSYL